MYGSLRHHYVSQPTSLDSATLAAAMLVRKKVEPACCVVLLAVCFGVNLGVLRAVFKRYFLL